MAESNPQEPVKESRERKSARRFVVPGLIAATALSALGYMGLSGGGSGGEQAHKAATPVSAAPSPETTTPSPETQEQANTFPDVIKRGDKLKCLKGVAIIDNPNPVDIDDNVRIVANPILARRGGEVFVSAGTTPQPDIPPVDMPTGMVPLKDTDTLLVIDADQPVENCTYTDRQEILMGDDPTTPERRFAPATHPQGEPLPLNASLLKKGVFALQLPQAWAMSTDLSNPGHDGTTWIQDLNLDPASTTTAAKVAKELPEAA